MSEVLNSASANTESMPEGHPLGGATIPLDLQGGDAPINSVSDNGASAEMTNAITNVSGVETGSEPNIRSAID